MKDCRGLPLSLPYALILSGSLFACRAVWGFDELTQGSGVLSSDDGGLFDGSTEQATGTDSPAPDSPLTGKLVFVTRTEYRVNDPTGIQSTQGANQLCQQSAIDAGLPGTFYAWLSNTAESPATKFVALIKAGPPPKPEQLITTNNQLVAVDYTELLDGGPRIALAVTEVGTTLPMAAPANGAQCPGAGVVWTATSTVGASANPIGGELTANCYDWQSAGQGAFAVAGRMAKHQTQWTQACSLACNASARLYCFQQ